MNRFSESFDPDQEFVRPAAVGQVAIIPFQEQKIDFKSLAELELLQTARVIKPRARWAKAYFKFCGGMVLPEEVNDFVLAAQRELKQETGIACPLDGFREIHRTQKRQHAPHHGEFDVVLYAAFGCDFSTLFNPLYGEVGDEDEEAALVQFGDITKPDMAWPVPTSPLNESSMFPLHLEWLRQVEQNMK